MPAKHFTYEPLRASCSLRPKLFLRCSDTVTDMTHNVFGETLNLTQLQLLILSSLMWYWSNSNDVFCDLDNIPCHTGTDVLGDQKSVPENSEIRA